VNAVKDQTDEIDQTSKKIQELGKQIEDLNKSLSPGGQVNIII
jgi:peptidoglycan hydrolase CwlO-like protein